MVRYADRHDVREAVEDVVGEVVERVEPLVGRARDEAGDLVERAAVLADRARVEAAPYVEQLSSRLAAEAAAVVAAAVPLVETVGGVLEDASVRGGAAWDALRGERVGPPVAVRRWPWAVGAAVAGALAGAAVAYVASRLRTQDAPDAIEPEQVQAVVDRPDGPVDPQA